MTPSPALPQSDGRRMLVMRYRFIGDTLLTVPFLRNLRAAFPQAQIDILTAPNSGELLEPCPYVNKVLYYDRKTPFWRMVRRLQANRYDTAFVLKRSFSSAALAFLAGIPNRIGFNTEGRGFLLTKRIPYTRTRHERDQFLSMLEALSIPVSTRHLEAWWTDSDAGKVDQTLKQGGLDVNNPAETHLVLHLTSSNPAKDWPMDEALPFIQALLERGTHHLHALGSLQDGVTYELIRQKLSPAAGTRLHNHCGRFTLTGSMAFLKRMHGVIGVDSGTLHMAAAADIPVVALFGPMSETLWRPLPPHAPVELVTRPLACRPCHLTTPCPHQYACMREISAGQVLEALKRVHLL